MAFSGEFPYFFVESCTVSQYDPVTMVGKEVPPVESPREPADTSDSNLFYASDNSNSVVDEATDTTRISRPSPSAFIPHTSYRHGTPVYSKQQSCTSWQLYS